MQKNISISPQKSFVSGVLAGHDNRVSCLGVTEVNVFVYKRGRPSKRMLRRLHHTPIGWKSNCNWSLGLVSSNLVP